MPWRAFFHLFYFLLIILFGHTNAVKCPARCRCYWELDSLVVNCARLGLYEYPDLDDVPVAKLILSENHFTEFPADFSSTELLTYLDLSNNNIQQLNENSLRGFNVLETLNLANNSFDGWASINPSEVFQPASNLQHLILSGNPFYSFINDNRKKVIVSESLLRLELERCDIRTAGGDVLINGLPNLEHLILSGNELANIPQMPSRSLRILELSNSNMQVINFYLIQGLPLLEKLDLSRNGGIQLGAGINNVIESESLHELDLSYCNLDKINLEGLPNLVTLKLRGNMLRSVDNNFFGNLSLIETLDLSANSLRTIESNAFRKLRRLTNVNLSYNEIALVDRHLFQSNEMLIALNLSRNVIERLTTIVSSSLRDINLSWNEIIGIESTALTSLTSLQRLDLSHNLIKVFPSGIISNTLKKLDLSNCRLTNLRNTTFRDFPELTSLHLNGNRFTNPFPSNYLRSNKFLDEIWLADNPWICNCHDPIFIEFHNYLTIPPQRLKDKFNARCASPVALYGKQWEDACIYEWMPNARTSNAEKVWTSFLLIFACLVGSICLYTCFQKWIRNRKDQRSQREYQENQEELDEVRRLNRRILNEDSSPNAPTVFDVNLPSYEDALLMPKLERPAKSMVDLTATSRSRRSRLSRSRTDPNDSTITEAEEADIMLDYSHRFRSEEMLQNRDKERTAFVPGPQRRTGYIEYNSRRFSTEESRFPPAHIKTQNLQSAEKIANFQGYEHSPYTKRKPKIAEIPPFKRATMRADSVEFLTDPEFDANSKPGSPFARRKPKSPGSPDSNTKIQIVNETTKSNDNNNNNKKNKTTNNYNDHIYERLAPAVEDYFGNQKSRPDSIASDNDFQLVVQPEIASLASSSSLYSEHSKSKNIKGNISNDSSSDKDPIVIVHKPIRETLF